MFIACNIVILFRRSRTVKESRWPRSRSE